ncbi:prepilin-type N-terminal cleavage/methylation domain-containing protein [Desulfopila sp. IMCC35006]|uniref:PilW family protein n=1 Tax=Desulfopila sp. IMCC35006 TaxID=2569542 RepID=UPI0010ABD102|nr:prepilin-type N-terminal cleavage/methylation domain-containing protein [Desulfopila sp. IMCC35006]TKB26447.1 prepilin-type N-terminal cleavage/methylation domain-containing protein [Desulfopila sp. IMCC35006]
MMEDIGQKGFTLIELMVAMAISGMLMAVVAMAYTGQSRSNNTVQDVSSLQQDMRSALQLMAREIRMAGYNPKSAGAKIELATATDLRFTEDIDNDGTIGSGEDIRYAINSNGALGRETGGGGGLQAVAENIDQLAYEYLLDDATWTQTPADLTKIRAVKIMILGHSDRETAGVVDTSTFTPPLQTIVPPAVAPAPPDWTPADPGGYHWRMMSLIVQCRNLQIKS